MPRRTWRYGLPLLVVLALVIVALVFVLPVRGPEAPARLAAALRDTGLLGIVIFVLIYMISAIAFVPGSVLTLVAGFAYGPVWGLLLASPASVAGATAAFLLGRTLLRERAARVVARSPRVRAIDTAVGREGFRLVLLLRLSPLFPFNLLNYALSLSRIRLGTYVAASFLGMLPATAFYAYLGSLAPAAAELTQRRSETGLAGVMLYVAGFTATLLVVVLATRAARRALAAELPVDGT